MSPETPSYTVVLADARDEHHRVTVTAQSLERAGEMHDIASDIAEMGRKNLASRALNYESYRSDSQYADDLDRLARSYGLIAITKDGPRALYAVDADYSDRSGPWGDNVEAVDADEAGFQAAWQMNLNERRDPNDDGFLDALADHTIRSAVLAMPTAEEFASLVIVLADRHRRGESIEASVAALSALAAKVVHPGDGEAGAALASAA